MVSSSAQPDAGDASTGAGAELPSDSDQLSALARSLTPVQRHLILIAVSMGAMLHSMATTNVAVILPQLQGSLSATPDQISWLITLAVIGSVVATPVSGWLVDRVGWRNTMLLAVSGFGVATYLCATATSLAPMCVYRLLQGAFGAPMTPVAMAILLATYPDEDKAWSQAIHGVAAVLGQAMAPVIAGYFAEVYDWRWAFFFLIPIAVVALLMTLAWLPEGGKRRGSKLDWTGFVTLSIAVGAFQLMLDRGERLAWFESNLIITYAAVAAVGFAAFLWRSMGQQRPFIDLSLFRDKLFALGTIVIVVFGMVNFVPQFFYPVIMGSLQGYPETSVANILFIRGFGLMVGFVAVGYTGHRWPRATLAAGFVCAGVSGVQGIFSSLDMQYATVAWAAFFHGMGVALIWVPVIVMAFSTLPPVLLAQSSGLFHLLRQLASSVSLAVVVAVTVRTGAISYSELSARLNPDSLHGSWDTESLAGLAQLSAELERQAQMIGYANGFFLYTIACVMGLVVSLLLRGKRR